MKITSPSNCDPYWESADWLPPWYILDRWCHRDEACIQAKLQALLSACERGEVQHRRSDGKTFDDPVHELLGRGKLLVNRHSFNQWCTALEGKTPLAAAGTPSAPATSTPPWARQYLTRGPTASDASSTAAEPPSAPHIAPPTDVITVDATDSDTPSDATDAEDRSPAASEDLPEHELRQRGVTADEIIDAFRVKFEQAKNREWWNERFTNATRYKKILVARVQKGKASRGGQHFPSWWDPFFIASWLISEGHMNRERVVRVLEQSFPNFAVNAHLL